jgi:N-acetylneuraminate synthase
MTIIIAEAGVNHNGDKELALSLVHAAVKAGADIIKFQTFRAEELTTQHTQQADYQIKNSNLDESQLAMLKKLELSDKAFLEIKLACDDLGIGFMSTAFDSPSLNFLVKNIGVETLKVPSGEITNAPLILEHAITGKDIILSTGMSNIDEIRNALSVIAFGYASSSGELVSDQSFRKFFKSKAAQESLKNRVTLLHCTSEYPAPFEDLNLNAMHTLEEEFNLQIGYSDHSLGIEVPIAAVAMGAKIIEKHFTLDKAMEGPDHRASIEPHELERMIKSIRNVDLSLGSPEKKIQTSELKNISLVRKSIVAIDAISPGEVLSKANIGIKRPGTGVSPFKYWNFLGKKSKNAYQEGDLIDE